MNRRYSYKMKTHRVLCLLLVLLCFSSCTTRANDNTNDLIKSGPHYEITKDSDGTYHYRIFSADTVIADETAGNRFPNIDYLDHFWPVIRVQTSAGTNAHGCQYYDVNKKVASKHYTFLTGYADYWDDKNGEGLFASFPHELIHDGTTYLRIETIFDESFSVIIDKGFTMMTCDKMIFLNEKQLYVEYPLPVTDASADEQQFKTVREVIDFRE